MATHQVDLFAGKLSSLSVRLSVCLPVGREMIYIGIIEKK